MKTFKLIFILFAFVFIMIGCNDDDKGTTDELETVGILGNWEIKGRSFNGIVPLIMVCCEFIEFKADENVEDFMGTYQWSDGQQSGNGTFDLDASNMVLSLRDNNDVDTFQMIISETRDEFELIYIDSQDVEIRETWIRVD